MADKKENKNSASKIAANNRYNQKTYDYISFVVPKGTKAVFIEKAEAMGYTSLNQFIKAAIQEKIERG